MKAKVSFHVEIPLSDINPGHLDQIKSHLTLQVRDYMTGEYQKVEYFYVDENAKTITLPQFYPMEVDEVEFVATSGQPLSSGYSITPDFKYKPGQEDDVNKCLIKDIITLMKPPGSGKTIIGSCAIFKRGVRSLILVDQNNLSEQWLDALKLVYKDTIKVSNKFALDGKGKDHGYDVYVTTIQGIVAKIRKYGIASVREWYKKYDIGHVLLDECHVLVGPEKFSQFGHICNSKYVLALSATPKDNVYFQYWLGVDVEGDKDYVVSPTIVEMSFNAKMNYKEKYINWGGKFHKDRHANILFKDEHYLDLIRAVAYKSFINKRQFLAICDFNKFGVDAIYDHIIKLIPKEQVAKFIGGQDRIECSSKPIIISNYKMLQKGADIKTLDTLLMASEIGDLTALEQTVGRLLRFLESITKKELLVFDIQETSLTCNLWRKDKRFSFYREKNFTII